MSWPNLKRMREYKLTFGKVLGGLEAFSDADWGSQPHWHSISGYVVILNGGTVAFGLTKQGIFALSTAEAECIALVLATTTAIFICNLLSEIIRPFDVPLVMHCDNQAAIAISKTGQYHSRLKHIDMKFKFVHEAVEQEIIDVVYCPTDYMPVYVFTKALRPQKVQHFAHMMGLF